MTNFFTGNADLAAQFENLNLERVVDHIEDGYRQSDQYMQAPRNFAEARDGYKEALELVGDIAANVIAPQSAAIDAEGSRLVNGRVEYAAGTDVCLDALRDAGLFGVLIPRRYGGSNLPVSVYIMMVEMVSRGDASLMTLFGYQDVTEAIAKYASDELAQKVLPRYAAGESICAMVLTEPNAGSDLQAIKLQARQDEDGQWRLNGVKQFISNGCGDLLLILARSEADSNDIFGLSLFVCEANDRIKVGRVEDKMGLHGSPTCELRFDDAPAELVGRRRFGLVKYVLPILNHARFSVAAQALGIAEAAYECALQYAQDRHQFGRPIYDIPAITGILMDARVELDASRALLYFGVQWLESCHRLEEEVQRHDGQNKDELRSLRKEESRVRGYVDLLSPLTKYVVTEAASQVCHNAQQVHGGMGYMKELPLERFVRDVRITTIYEGPSQVQIATSINLVLRDILKDEIESRIPAAKDSTSHDLANKLRALRQCSVQLIESGVALADAKSRDAAAKPIVDVYARTLSAAVLLQQAGSDKRRQVTLRRYLNSSLAIAQAAIESTTNGHFQDFGERDLVCLTAKN